MQRWIAACVYYSSMKIRVCRCNNICSIEVKNENFFFFVPITMCDEKHDPRINLKFLVKLKETPSDCFKLLKDTYDGNFLFRACVFEWCKWFSESRETTKDD